MHNIPPEIEVSVQDPAWEELDNIHDLVQLAATKTLSNAILPKIAVDRKLEASVVLANDDLVQVLNREYNEKDKPTNVLTFASLDDAQGIPEEGNLHLGDVILAFQTIEREAQEQGKFPLDHVKHLVVHGALHLLGYDHQTDEQATDMETLEIRILEQLGVQNPYTEADFDL
ncbi:MAG: rRNA maturation RNase YbeY [Alphaproteobacteria bacterium]|nr:rRNA maturation RNase YbeY [Alphaproteobacteria bacterium]